MVCSPALMRYLGTDRCASHRLILHGREGEALEVLSALNDLDIDDNQIHQEFLQIKDAVIEMSKGSFTNVFRMGDYRDGHRVILAVVLQFCQQICGMSKPTIIQIGSVVLTHAFSRYQLYDTVLWNHVHKPIPVDATISPDMECLDPRGGCRNVLLPRVLHCSRVH